MLALNLSAGHLGYIGPMETLQRWLKNERGEGYVALQVVYLAFVLLGPREVPGLPRLTGIPAVMATGLGLVVGVFGGLVAVWGLIGLGRNLTALPHPVDDGQLVTEGPYRVVRHPIYSGVILGSLGWALLWSSPFLVILALGLFLFFDIKSRREEVWLRHRYAGYADYARRTRKLIPYVY